MEREELLALVREMREDDRKRREASGSPRQEKNASYR